MTTRILLISIAVLTIWLAWFFGKIPFKTFEPGDELVKFGQWGDSFGALSSLFAAFAFIGTISTLFYQQQQNRFALQDQHRQRFESSFFELLRLFRETRDRLMFNFSEEYQRGQEQFNSTFEGSAALEAAWKEMDFWIEREPDRDRVAKIYEKRVHEPYDSSFGPYFRVLYSILNKIKKDDILSDEEKSQYAKLVRSQLSGYEVAIVGINGLSSISDDLHKMIEEFRLLKYVPSDRRRTILQRFYSSAAFLSRDKEQNEQV